MTTRSEHRADVDARIMAEARRQLAEHGASGLGMRAIARELELTPGALYRYVADRDALLTRLIVEAYDSLGEAVERAAEEARPRGARAAWVAVWLAALEWSEERPHEFALLYGTPVVGYAAPETTIGPASRLTGVLAGISLEGASSEAASRSASPAAGDEPPAGLAADLARIRAWVAGRFGEEAEARASDAQLLEVVRSWTELVGTLAFVRFGHYAGSIESPAPYVELAARRRADSLGLG